VAFDFWDQVERAEEFDEIKQYRPSAFLALPIDPGTGPREAGTGKALADGESEAPGSQLRDPGVNP